MKKILCTKGSVDQFRQAVEDRIAELNTTAATNTSNIPAKTEVECDDEIYDRDEYLDMLENSVSDELANLIDDDVVVEYRFGNYAYTIIVTDPVYGVCRFDIEDEDLGFTFDSLAEDTQNIVDAIVEFVEIGEVNI